MSGVFVVPGQTAFTDQPTGLVLKAERVTGLAMSAGVWARVLWENAVGQTSWLSGTLLTLPAGFGYEILATAFFANPSSLYYAIELNGALASDFFQFTANDLSNFLFVHDIVPAGSYHLSAFSPIANTLGQSSLYASIRSRLTVRQLRL
jgi:hypothetical protein